MRFLTLPLLLILALMAYIRFAPSSAERWHKMPELTGPGDDLKAGSFRAERVVTGAAQEVLAAIEQRALATPRTRVLAGSVDEGMITFESRSLWMGYPDYTTVAVNEGVLVIYGRLRFGRSDFGVNRARIMGWLETLGPLTAPL